MGREVLSIEKKGERNENRKTIRNHCKGRHKRQYVDNSQARSGRENEQVKKVTTGWTLSRRHLLVRGESQKTNWWGEKATYENGGRWRRKKEPEQDLAFWGGQKGENFGLSKGRKTTPDAGNVVGTKIEESGENTRTKGHDRARSKELGKGNRKK